MSSFLIARLAVSWSLVSASALLAASAVLPLTAQADTFPSKPITLVVAYPPGGSTDLTGRTLGAELSRKLGVPILELENKVESLLETQRKLTKQMEQA